MKIYFARKEEEDRKTQRKLTGYTNKNFGSKEEEDRKTFLQVKNENNFCQQKENDRRKQTLGFWILKVM